MNLGKDVKRKQFPQDESDDSQGQTAAENIPQCMLYLGRSIHNLSRPYSHGRSRKSGKRISGFLNCQSCDQQANICVHTAMYKCEFRSVSEVLVPLKIIILVRIRKILFSLGVSADQKIGEDERYWSSIWILVSFPYQRLLTLRRCLLLCTLLIPGPSH